RYAPRLNSRWWRWPLVGPEYHMLANALFWADEIPLFIGPGRGSLEDALRGLWSYRTGLMLGETREWGELWELGKQLFPRWVGFHPSRRQPSRRNIVVYRAGRIATARFIAELDKEIEAQDTKPGTDQPS